MHRLLEQYLAEVAKRLSPLPVSRRNEELREMRQHLQNAVLVNREFGQSEDEAVQSAVDQFGTPNDLGESIVQTWRRGQAIRRRDTAKSAVCTSLLTLVLPRLVFPLVKPHILQAFQLPLSFTLICLVVILSQIPIYLLIGGFSGYMFPKRAVAGAGIGVSALAFIHLVYHIVFLIQFPIKGQETAATWTLDFSLNLISRTINDAVYIFAILAGAWAGSLWRGRQARLAVFRP